ncbi:SH3 domain-containing protein [Bacillus badius]|uniref:SH3 domain-containing protein n=1 Tax=Bacillus badius TaxID=1455 RepID=UPI0006982AD8|nr:SH3 domain-containing protein [Bacillus badius]
MNKLDVREKPSPKAKIVGSLKKGVVVFVYNTEPGGWSKVKYNNKAGYIATSGLKGKVVSTKPAPPAKTTPVLMKDIKFGMTYQQVKSKENRTIVLDTYGENPSYLVYNTKKYDADTELVYVFKHNKLDSAWYNFNPSGAYYNSNQLKKKYSSLKQTAIGEYGKKYIEDNFAGYSSLWIMNGYDVMLHAGYTDGQSRFILSYHKQKYQGASVEDKEDRLNELMKEVDAYDKNINK